MGERMRFSFCFFKEYFLFKDADILAKIEE